MSFGLTRRQTGVAEDTFDEPGLSFVRAPLSPMFVRRVVALSPGEEIAYDETAWQGAFVVVEEGEIEFECQAGGKRRFECGSQLWMDGLELRWLRNPGTEATVLVAISRR